MTEALLSPKKILRLRPGKFIFLAVDEEICVAAREGLCVQLISERGTTRLVHTSQVLEQARPLNRAGEKFLQELLSSRWVDRPLEGLNLEGPAVNP